MGPSFLLLLAALTLVQSRTSQSRVKVTTYFESLCPDSINFFRNQLKPACDNIGDIMDIEIYAYGKANDSCRDTSDGYKFKCQHGTPECYANKMLTCAKKLVHNRKTYIDFALCVMTTNYPPSAGSTCAGELDVPFFLIEKCANSTEGEDLLHDVGVRQSKLNPPLTYVPWIIVGDIYSNKKLERAQKDLQNLVCDEYQGSTPPACNVPSKLTGKEINLRR